MATQLDTAADCGILSPRRGAEGWRGFHVFYHGDRDRVLTELVRPLTAALVADGMVCRFFCIRYNLGGRHVRLRLEVDDADVPAVSDRVHAAAAGFFRRRPSTSPSTIEEIRRENATIIVGDPFTTEDDNLGFADNSVAEFPVEFEIARYGGPALYEHALDFFTLSTLDALDVVETWLDRPGGRRMASVARQVLRQAWGHARGADEFFRLAGYALGTIGPRLPGFVPLADTAFERGRKAMCTLVRGELAALARPGEGPALAEAARALAHKIRGVAEPDRLGIDTSQMHMTVNRLGLVNGEEVYLCRMLERTLEAIMEEDPGWWGAVWEAHRERVAAPVRPLRQRMASALAELTGGAERTAGS